MKHAVPNTKKRGIFAAPLLIILFLFFHACEEEDNYEQDGKDAASAFCNCLENDYSISKCEEELKDKYSHSTYTSSDFKKGFDAVGKSCSIEWQITRE